MPKISCIMPTFNRDEYLAEAVESILNQSSKDFELIVVDDGSTDDTEELMTFLAKKDKRIEYIKLPQNVGIAKARNAGVMLAEGEYIAVMDSDDIASPDRFKKQLKAIKDADFVYSSYLQASEDGAVFALTEPDSKLTIERLKEDQQVPHVTIMAKAKCFKETPYRENLTANDDQFLIWDWFKAGYTYKSIKEPLMIVRYHQHNVSKDREEFIKKTIEQYKAEVAEYEKTH